MGLFDFYREYRRRKTISQKSAEYWQLINGYHPVYSNYNGNLYEMAQVRSAIHAAANHRSKLSVEVVGPRYRDLAKVIGIRVNPFQTTSQFLYKVSTTLDCTNSCIIIPIYDSPVADHIVGFWPVNPQAAEIIENDGEVYIRYSYYGQSRAIELDRCGVVRKMDFRSEIFGDSNAALFPTLDLIEVHNKSIQEAVKASAAIRFLAKLTGTFKPDDVSKERKRFVDDNLSGENGGVMLIDSKYADVKQLDSKPIVVDDKQLAAINDNVNNYFGVSPKILQNCFTSDEWAAFYEGAVEPFAIQLSQVLSSMLFTPSEIAAGSMIYLSANRLQYASNQEKIDIVAALFDRGLLTVDQGLEIFQMPPIGGDEGAKRHIRKDYIDLSLLGAEIDPALAAVPSPGKEESGNASENEPGVQDNGPGDPKS